MKSYNELKTEMKAIQQHMVKTKSNERTDALIEAKRLCKEFGFIARFSNKSLDIRRGEK